MIAPAHAGASLDHVDDALDLAVVVGAGLGTGVVETVPAHSFSAPARACVIAAARFMPGVCGVLRSSSSERTSERATTKAGRGRYHGHDGPPDCGAECSRRSFG